MAFVDAYYDKALENKKLAMLLHAAEDEASEVFESFSLSGKNKKKLSVLY